MKIREIFCRSILSPSKIPGCDYTLNPYVGCQHSCCWCYAKFMKGYTGHDEEEWGSFVDVKINAPEVLIKEMRKLKIFITKRKLILTGKQFLIKEKSAK